MVHQHLLVEPFGTIEPFAQLKTETALTQLSQADGQGAPGLAIEPRQALEQLGLDGVIVGRKGPGSDQSEILPGSINRLDTRKLDRPARLGDLMTRAIEELLDYDSGPTRCRQVA